MLELTFYHRVSRTLTPNIVVVQRRKYTLCNDKCEPSDIGLEKAFTQICRHKPSSGESKSSCKVEKPTSRARDDDSSDEGESESDENVIFFLQKARKASLGNVVHLLDDDVTVSAA